MTDRVSESLKWLGIDEDKCRPKRDIVYYSMVKLAKKFKRPATGREIAADTGLPSPTVQHIFMDLYKDGRAMRTAGGWIPLKGDGK